MAQLSETWQPVQLLQSVCSQAASVCVLQLRQPSSEVAAREEPLQVLLSLHEESLCCSLLPGSAAGVNAAAAPQGSAARETAATATAGAASSTGGIGGGALPAYLQRSFWCPLKLTDESIDEGVAAFAACELQEADTQSSDEQGDHTDRQEHARYGLVLTCGASGLMRLMLLLLQQPQQPQHQQHQQLQQRDPAMQIVERRLGGVDADSSSSGSSSRPWAQLQQLQKWKLLLPSHRLHHTENFSSAASLATKAQEGTSSVARVATISSPFSFSAAGKRGATETTVATVRLVAVGCVGGELELLLLQHKTVVRCSTLKHPTAITTLRFHPSRALLAVGTAEGPLHVYDISFAAAAAAAAAAPAAAEHIPCLVLKDHLSSITALSFIPAASLAALQQQQQRVGGGGVKRKAAATSGATEQRLADGLVSAAGDSLVNLWDLSSLPDSAGLLPALKEKDFQQHLQDMKKSCLRLQKRLQEQQQKHQQQPLLQLPTLEIVTSLLLDSDQEASVGGAPGAPFLLSGGATGLVKLWSLCEKKTVKVLRTATTVASGREDGSRSEEDLGAFVRSLLLLPKRSKSSGSSSERSLLIAQDSGLISLVSPLQSLMRGLCSSADYPSSLLLLTGDPCAWYLDLTYGSLGFKPVGGTESLRFAAVGQQQTEGHQAAMEGHQAAISCCDVSKNGCWILTGGKDGSLCVWHRASDRLVARMQAAHAGCLTAVAFQRQKCCAVVPGSQLGQLASCVCQGRGYLSHFFCRKDSMRMSACRNNASALVKTRPDLECCCDCRGISPAQPHHLLFASCCDQNSVKLWRLAIPASLFIGKEAEGTGGPESDSQADFRFGDIQVLEEIECLASIVAHAKEINDLKFAPNDSLIATASQDKTCRLLAVPSLAAKGELKGHRRGVHEVQFATRERTAATASGDATIKLWNLQTMTCIKTLQGDGFGFLCLRFLSLDSQLISFNSNGEAQIWNCRTAECASKLQPVHTDKVWSVDLWGEALASAGADGRICIWRDVTTETKAAVKQKALREQQELAAAQTLEATGQTEEVVGLLLRLKKKYALGSFIQRRLLRSLSASLDASDPAALLRKGSLSSLVKLLPEQQHQLLRKHLPPQQQALLQQERVEEDDWGDIISRLGEDEIKTLFGFVAEWTAADPVTAAAADGLLYLLLTRFPQEMLFKSSRGSSKTDGKAEETDIYSNKVKPTVGGKLAEDVLKALVLSSQRHERRLIGLLQKSYLLDLLLPGAAAVQQDLQQLLRPLQQDAGKKEAEGMQGKRAKKKRKTAQQQQHFEDEQEEFVLDPNVLQPHFGSEFTDRCLYGDA
ncbi:hypothetical protein Efla_000599 [Eimeria flavescens]